MRYAKRIVTAIVAVVPVSGLMAMMAAIDSGEAGATSSTLTFNSGGVHVVVGNGLAAIVVDASLSELSVTGMVGNDVFTSGEPFQFSGSVAGTTFTVNVPSGALVADDDMTSGTGNVYNVSFTDSATATLTGAGSPFAGCGLAQLGPVSFDDTIDTSAPYSLQADLDPTVITESGASGPQITGSCSGSSTLASELQSGVKLSASPLLEVTSSPA